MTTTAGKTTTTIAGYNFWGKHADAQADGSVVVTGMANRVEHGVATTYMAALRYLADGRLDTGFGVDGIVTAASPYVTNALVGTQTVALNTGGVLQADGKLLLIGSAYVGTTVGTILSRYLPDGSLDTGFGAGGHVSSILPNGSYFASSVLEQPDGKILVAGFGVGQRSSEDFTITRYNNDGSVDQQFFLGQIFTDDLTGGLFQGSNEVSFSMSLQNDGKILIVGQATLTGGQSTFCLMRVGSDGFPDLSFGSGGGGLMTFTYGTGAGDSSGASSVLALANGKFLVAGHATVSGQTHTVLTQLNADGVADEGFGLHGLADEVALPGGAANYESIAVQADGKILVAGNLGADFGLVRYTADGHADSIVPIAVGLNAKAHHVSVEADGKILVAGESTQTIAGVSQSHFTLVRLNADLSLDATFHDTVDTAVSHTLGATEQNLLLTGSDGIEGHGNALNNILTGNTGDNLLDGGDGNDILDGGAGADTLVGGNGNDIYVVDQAGDVVLETGGAGDRDTVHASVSFVLADGLENLTLLGAAAIDGGGNGADNILTGNSGANRLDGGDGNDVLDGGAGADTLLGGNGSDSYYVDNAGDVVIDTGGAAGDVDTVYTKINYTLGDTLENLTIIAGLVTGTGNALDNVLTSGSSADTLVGGLGNDTYVVNSSADKVVETSTLAGETDTVLSSASSYVLSANVEHLTLTGSADISGTGNGLDNLIIGNSGSNVLDGGAGADTLVGGLGADTYVLDNPGDVVVETDALDPARDTVRAGFDYVLGSNVENLSLTGTAIHGTGNELDNVIVGNAASNLLDGGAGSDSLNGGTGADTMMGGSGNDTYTVDNAGDIVIEQAAPDQIDTVLASISYVLANAVENLTLTGALALNGTGNALDNVITGNGAANVLDGGAGADTLIGGLGNDSYVVDHIGDVVIETSTLATEIDQVTSSISYTLGVNVENLTLSGSADLSGTGNALANVLTGNAGNNVLTGGAGNDTLIGMAGADIMDGGSGADTYSVDNVNDVVLENPGAGTDTVQSVISYTLGANLENLVLNGTAAINGSGNELANTLTGNSGANVLVGGDGNDTLSGGAGADTLIGGHGVDLLVGGSGADVFVIGPDDESIIVRDTIGDLKVAEGDKIDLTQFDAYPLLAGRQPLTFVAGFSADATGQVKYSMGLLQISTDADALPEYVITLTGSPAITAANLIL